MKKKSYHGLKLFDLLLNFTIKIYIVTDKLIEISFYNSCFQKNILLVEFCCQHLQCVEIYDKDTKKIRT